MFHLISKLDRLWRVFRTGIAFATFMVGGLLMSLTAFPMARIWPGSKEVKGRRIRRLVQLSFVAFVRWMTMLRVLRRPQVEGLEHVLKAGPCLIIANHPTLIDVVLLISVIRDCNCVVKRSLWDHFFIRRVVRGAEYIPNDDGPQLMADCQAGFKTGRPLIIFPEGTRSPENELNPFSRGAAQIALRAGVPVVPVIIRCSPPTLMKHQRWYDVPGRAVQLTLSFQPVEAVPPEVLQLEEFPRQVRALTRHFEEYYKKNLFG